MDGTPVRLIKSYIDAIAPERKTRLYWDDQLKGFGLRVSPTGLKAFVVSYRVGRGRRAQKRLDTIGRYGPLTPDQARAEARRRLSQAALGQDVVQQRRAREAELTVKDMLERWAATGALTNRRTGRVRNCRNAAGDIRRVRAHVLPRLGAVPLSQLKRSDIEALREAVRSGDLKYKLKTRPRGVQEIKGGEGTAVRTVATLRSALSWAVDQGLIEHNPAARVKLPQPRRKITPLSGDQLKALGAVLRLLEGEYPEAVQIIRLLALTGARKSEIEKLRWNEIAPDWGSLRLTEAKTETRVIHVCDEAAQILQARKRRQGCEHVFPATRGDGHYQHMPKVWEKALKLAGLPPTLRRHDLRHTFATLGASEGVPSLFVQTLLGHGSLSTTEIYFHAANAEVRKANEHIGRRMGAMLRGDRDEATPRAANDR